jgi:hypothetical protein
VSTGIVGLFAENRSTTSAVLGPTPCISISFFLASSVGRDRIELRLPLKFSRTVFEAVCIVLALLL